MTTENDVEIRKVVAAGEAAITALLAICDTLDALDARRRRSVAVEKHDPARDNAMCLLTIAALVAGALKNVDACLDGTNATG